MHKREQKIDIGFDPEKRFSEWLDKCDNTICVKPDHLFLGTHQDNMDDARTKRLSRNSDSDWKE